MKPKDYNQWASYTRTRVKRGEIPLFPGMKNENDVINTDFSMSENQVKLWRQRVREAVMGGNYIPTPSDFLGELKRVDNRETAREIENALIAYRSNPRP